MNQSDLLALLEDLRDFLNNQADAEYDENGKLIGNKAMTLYCEVDQAYMDIERSGVTQD